MSKKGNHKLTKAAPNFGLLFKCSSRGKDPQSFAEGLKNKQSY